MFTEDTVFILGAGASWHYGYPTGEGLIAAIKEKAKRLSIYVAQGGIQSTLCQSAPKYFDSFFKTQTPAEKVNSFLKECDLLHKKIEQCNPLVIDYFLDKNPSLQNIGKFLIAYVILECEANWKLTRCNQNWHKQLKESPYKSVRDTAEDLKLENFNDDWMKFVLHKLIVRDAESKSKNLVDNKMSFITFNYDISLERRIYEALEQIEMIKDDEKEALYKKDFVFHVYGKVLDKPFENMEKFGCFPVGLSPQSITASLDMAFEASKNLQTILEAKTQNSDEIEDAINALKLARRVFFLGYGFDRINNQILKIKDCLNGPNELPTHLSKDIDVSFTNFGNSNLVNKAAGLNFLGKENAFLDSSLETSQLRKGRKYEKSVNSVYDALAKDFYLG